jgi:hypothetical protein
MMVVTQAELLEVVQICPVSLTNGDQLECPEGTDSFNLPASSASSTAPDSKRELRMLGRFTNSDAPQVVSDNFIDWSAPSGSSVAAVDANGVVGAGTVVGSVAVTGTIKSGVYPNASPRGDDIVVNITDRVCVLPLLAADGASATGSTDVESPTNVIDSDPNNFATATLEAGPFTTTVTLSVLASNAVEYDAVGQAGFVIEHANNSQINPAENMELVAYNNNTESGRGAAVVKALGGATSADRRRQLIYFNVPTSQTKFDRLDVEVAVPGFLDSGDPTAILDALLYLLNQGNSTSFDVYSACAKVNLN